MLSGKRILVVDDAFDVQQLIAFFLEKAGASVVQANNGRIGLKCLHQADADQAPIDLILLDQQMPEMDGPTMASEVRRLGKELPIVAISAFTSLECRLLAREAGCNAFIAKPFQRKNLLEVILSSLNQDSRVVSTFEV